MQYGLGLRPAHYDEIINAKPAIDWFECLTEDFIDLHGPDFLALEKIRAHYPISLHGVGLSIGSSDPLNNKYLSDLKKLIEFVNPIFVSDHFCWTGIDKINTHDLLPLPYTDEAIDHVVSRIIKVQDFLGRQMMFENVSSYVDFSHSSICEWEFIAEIVKRADCFILLDINNIYVNAFNHGFSPDDYLRGIPVERVKQFHLSGHKNCGTHIIDTHDDQITNAVWSLYQKAVVQFPDTPLIIERDANIPSLAELVTELNVAKVYCDMSYNKVAQEHSHKNRLNALYREKNQGNFSLKKIQRNFQLSIVHQRDLIAKHITSSENLTAKQRVQIYQNGYYARIIVALKQDFPTLCESIGDSAFESLVCDYINHHPSKNYNLRLIGKNLAKFIISRDPDFYDFAMLAEEEYKSIIKSK